MKFPMILTLSLIFVGCAEMGANLKPSPKVKHIHRLLITDQKGNPVEGVSVKLIAEERKSKVKDTTVVTSDDGFVITGLTATSDPAWPDIYAYSSTVSYEVNKDSYYKNSASTKIEKSGQKSEMNEFVQTASDTIRLLKPTDYFSETYFSKVDKTDLKVKILSFIDDIRVEGYLADSYLEPFSIDLKPFKSKNYLNFEFKNSNVYNSLKLNKYDIAKTLFDEVVRKVLSPLNNYISDPKSFYGYNISVIGYSKDFSEEDASNTKLTYNFLMPADVIGKYKEKGLFGRSSGLKSRRK